VALLIGLGLIAALWTFGYGFAFLGQQNLQIEIQEVEDKTHCFQEARMRNVGLVRNCTKMFWGSGDQLELMLRKVGKASFTENWSTFIDVGASAYAATGGDISLAIAYEQLFKSEKKTIFAFEPFLPVFKELEQAAKQVTSQKPRLSIHVNHIGVGMDDEEMSFFGSKNIMTANPRIQNHSIYKGTEQMTIPGTRLDTFLAKHGVAHVNVLKTDTEGLEWEVLKGAGNYITERNVDLIIIAYEDKWTWDTFTACYPEEGKTHQRPSQEELDTPNLQSVMNWFDQIGYIVYLVGKVETNGKNEEVILVPCSNGYWDDDLEIGRDPKSYGLPFTWFDIIAVQRRSELQQFLEKESVLSQLCPDG
jgi:FkbM family methyltransferase